VSVYPGEGATGRLSDALLHVVRPLHRPGTHSYQALEHRGEINPSVSDLEWSAPVRPLERFGHSSVEVLNERQDLLAEILYRDEVAPL
jgi:hypothetical protein